MDFVIVGAGSAGCALAYRLSEDPGNAVTLIEAGGRYFELYTNQFTEEGEQRVLATAE